MKPTANSARNVSKITLVVGALSQVNGKVFDKLTACQPVE